VCRARTRDGGHPGAPWSGQGVEQRGRRSDRANLLPAAEQRVLALCTDDGVELDLGTPVNATPEESGGRCYTDSPDLDAPARHNRAVLSAALRGAGFVNYPTEWWHWSYGDRYWAMVTGAEAAIYGPREL